MKKNKVVSIISLILVLVFMLSACNKSVEIAEIAENAYLHTNSSIIKLSYEYKYAEVGTPVELPVVHSIDSNGKKVTADLSLTKNEVKIDFSNGAFIPEELGEFKFKATAQINNKYVSKTATINVLAVGEEKVNLIAEFSKETGKKHLDSTIGFVKGYSTQYKYGNESGSTCIRLESNLHRSAVRFNFLLLDNIIDAKFVYFYAYLESDFTKNLSVSSNADAKVSPSSVHQILQPNQWNLVVFTEAQIKAYNGNLNGLIMGVYQSTAVDGLDKASFYMSNMYAVYPQTASQLENKIDNLSSLEGKTTKDIASMKLEMGLIIKAMETMTAEELNKVSNLDKFNAFENKYKSLLSELNEQKLDNIFSKHQEIRIEPTEDLAKIAYFDSLVGLEQVSLTNATATLSDEKTFGSEKKSTKIKVNNAYSAEVSINLPAVKNISQYEEMYLYVYLDEEGSEGKESRIRWIDSNNNGIKLTAGKWTKVSILKKNYNLLHSVTKEATEYDITGATLKLFDWSGKLAPNVYFSSVYAKVANANSLFEENNVTKIEPTESLAKIAYFDTVIGVQQISAVSGWGSFTSNVSTDYVYGNEQASTKLTLAGTGEVRVAVSLPAIKDISMYDEIYFYAYIENGAGDGTRANLRGGGSGQAVLLEGQWVKVSIKKANYSVLMGVTNGPENITNINLRFYGTGRTSVVYISALYAANI